MGFRTRSKRGIGTTQVSVGVDAQQGSYDIFYEYRAQGGYVAAVHFRVRGRLEPDAAGDWASTGTIEGTFWKAWDGGNDYCIPYAVTGTVDLIGFTVEESLHIQSISSAKLDGDDLPVIPGPGGFRVPLSGGTDSRGTTARNPDEVDGSCFAFSNVTESITLTER